jgi:hypothetical protein
MNPRALLVLGVLVPFSLYSAWVVAQVGYVGLFTYALASPAGIQVLIDLVIACTLGLVWMRGDAKEHGVPFAPYVVLTLTLGSIGLLGYWLHREVRGRRAVGSESVATA